MEPQRWSEIQQIFDHLLDKTPSHRKDYLDMVCEDDRDLREQVEKLLRVNDDISHAPWLPITSENDLPESIGQYQINRLLGSGAMGKVYLGTDSLASQFALKLLPSYLVSDKKAIQRFEQEAQLLSRLKHANICGLKEVIWHADQPCLVLEYCRGVTLEDRLSSGVLAPGEVKRISLQIASALDCAHKQSVFHRDIKPGNVILDQQNNVKLIDFGIAKYADTKLTATGMILGSPNFMSPEQWRGQVVDGRTDLWSLGVLMHRMISGDLPFKGDTRQQLAVSVLQSKPRPLLFEAEDKQMQDIASIIFNLLKKNPDSRIATATELILTLEKINHD